MSKLTEDEIKKLPYGRCRGEGPIPGGKPIDGRPVRPYTPGFSAAVQCLDPERPDFLTIHNSGTVAQQADGARKALSLQPDVYKKAGVGLVFVAGADIHPLRGGALCERLSRICNYITPRGQVVEPPRSVLKAIEDNPILPDIRELIRISSIPIMRPDGSLQFDGYDEKTKILVQLAPDLAELEYLVPLKPSKEDATQASRRLLWHARGVHTNKVGHSIILAHTLSLAGRMMFGQCPGFAYDAPEPGSGKTTAFRHPYAQVYGEYCIEKSVPDSAGEWRKNMPHFSQNAQVAFDDVKHEFGSAELDRAITCEGKTGSRILGTQREVLSDLTASLWAVNGNGLRLARDTRTRFYVATIYNLPPEARDMTIEKPSAAYYAKHRRQALIDCFTILRAYVLAGKPAQAGHHSRFDDWRSLIQGAILWLGLADPVAGESLDTDGDLNREAMEALIDLTECLKIKLGYTFSAKSLELEPDPEYGNPALDKLRRAAREALGEVLARKDKRKDRTIKTTADVGYALAELRNKRVQMPEGQYARLKRVDDRPGKGAKYVIEYGTAAYFIGIMGLELKQHALIAPTAPPSEQPACEQPATSEDEQAQPDEQPALAPETAPTDTDTDTDDNDDSEDDGSTLLEDEQPAPTLDPSLPEGLKRLFRGGAPIVKR